MSKQIIQSIVEEFDKKIANHIYTLSFTNEMRDFLVTSLQKVIEASREAERKSVLKEIRKNLIKKVVVSSIAEFIKNNKEKTTPPQLTRRLNNK